MNKQLFHFHIFALSIWDKGYSGGDRIFIELSRRFIQKGHVVSIYTWERGKEIIKRENLKNVDIKIFPLQKWLQLGFSVQYFIRIIYGIWFSLRVDESTIKNKKTTILYCASDFWMDSLPCVILKKRFRDITWIGTHYLSAPNPFRGFHEKGGFKIPSVNGTIYYLQQLVSFPLIKKYSDLIFVTSEPSIKRFPHHKKYKKYIVIYGGVNLDVVQKLKKIYNKKNKIYEAIFMGRFHPQKGVLEIIDIWKKVVKYERNAKLVMIGDGDLMPQVKHKIQRLKLKNNILLKGYVLDGHKKYTLFAQSKIVVHPAVYDSGGMASAEAMAWGLPAISFDLEALRTYYPKGMLKVAIGDIDEFARTIRKLLSDRKLFIRTKRDAVDLIEEEWDWDRRSGIVLEKLNELISI